MEFLPLIVLSGLQVGCIYAMMALSYFVIIAYALLQKSVENPEIGTSLRTRLNRN